MLVNCKYGSGDRPLPAINDTLIITEGEAIERGYAELNRRWKVKKTYEFSIPFPPGGHVLRPGVFIRVTCPDYGLYSEVLYVNRITISEDGHSVFMRIGAESYEDWEHDTPIAEEGTYGYGLYGAGVYTEGSNSLL
jgi:hypothetical protein